MKILVDGMPRGIGGIGSLVMNIANYSKPKEDNLVFDFLLPQGSEYKKTLEENGYRYWEIPDFSQTIKYFNYVRKFFKENKYDYLWFNNTSKVNIILPLLAKKIGKAKLITHTHGVDFEEKGLKYVMFKVIDAINAPVMFAMVDVPLACSREAANVYYGRNERLLNKVVVVSNGIDTAKYKFSDDVRQSMRKEIGVDDNEILLGAVGRLSRVKNFEFIINIVKKLPLHYKLIILGDGELKDELNQLISAWKVEEKCKILGNRKNVPDYLSAMDIFLLPSLNEGMPFSVIEAQANGLPCIVTSIISKEVSITDLVHLEDIASKQRWIKLIEKTKLTDNRGRYSEIIKENGYGIEHGYNEFVEALRKLKV